QTSSFYCFTYTISASLGHHVCPTFTRSLAILLVSFGTCHSQFTISFDAGSSDFCAYLALLLGRKPRLPGGLKLTHLLRALRTRRSHVAFVRFSNPFRARFGRH